MQVMKKGDVKIEILIQYNAICTYVFDAVFILLMRARVRAFGDILLKCTSIADYISFLNSK